jgi:rhodanese-related sulfurtransferase
MSVFPHWNRLAKSPVLIEWPTYLSGGAASHFASVLRAELEQRGLGENAPLFFICRSGSRSRAAAITMTAAGSANCYNIGPGFEGPLDVAGHRNVVAGWRVSGFPWSQT